MSHEGEELSFRKKYIEVKKSSYVFFSMFNDVMLFIFNPLVSMAIVIPFMANRLLHFHFVEVRGYIKSTHETVKVKFQGSMKTYVPIFLLVG